MAIRIKRSSGNLAPALLESGQLAYTEGTSNGGTLYYGEIGGTVREIGGKKFVDKVNGIEAGAQVNTVTSVAGRTGAVTIGVADVSGAEATANKGQANGYASLNSSGLIPSSQLPSFVDDVLEYANLAGFPATGEAAKIYVAVDSGKTYRWSGSTYVEISASPGSTDAVSEGSTNLYYTDARARAAISATQNISYNNSTGVITGPDLSGYATSASLATVATTGAYADLTGKPSLFSGAYADLTGKPTLFSGSYTDLTNKPTLFSGAYADLSGKPDLTVYQLAANAFSGAYADLSGKPTIPDSILDLGITDGSAGQVLATNGLGGFSFVTEAVGLENVVEDTTPQLGGNLDVNGNQIVSASNGDIELAPNGTGAVILYSSTVEVGVVNTNVTVTTPGTSDLTLNTNGGTNSGSIVIADGSNSNISITPNGTGAVVIDGLSYPVADGTSGQFLKTNGSGVLSFSDVDDGTF